MTDRNELRLMEKMARGIAGFKVFGISNN